MNSIEYEQAVYAQAVWQLAYSSSQDELLAVACTLRNHVIPRLLGQVSSYATYLEACEDFIRVYPTRPRPSLIDPTFTWLLSQISGIYNCELPDLTSTHDHPQGAKYFSRVVTLEPTDRFYQEIIQKSGQHPLLGSFGSMQFFV